MELLSEHLFSNIVLFLCLAMQLFAMEVSAAMEVVTKKRVSERRIVRLLQVNF